MIKSMRKKAEFIVLSVALAGSLMGCSFSLNKDAAGSSKKIETTVTEETSKPDKTTSTDIGSDTETSEEAFSAAGSEGKESALLEEKEVGFGNGEMTEEYSNDMVIDSKLSCKVQTNGEVAVYHLPYINYDSKACENVNAQVEKIGDDYIAKPGDDYAKCIAIGYEWSIYQDLLSVVVRVDYEAIQISDFYVYMIDLSKDVLLSKNDVLAYLDIDENLYEKKVQDALDSYFTNTYNDMEATDSMLKEIHDQTLAMSNVREAVPYVDENSELCVICTLYTMAIPSYYSSKLSVDNLEDKCEYGGIVIESPYNNSTTEGYFSDDYILPYSDSEYLTEDDLDGLTPDEIRLACNELYARHERKFKDADYQAYFNSKSWYHGTVEPDDFDDTAVFNKYELANRDFIIAYEKEKGYK